jgi:hypothetical protein
MPHDAWLYGTKKKREDVKKAAVKNKGLFDASSEDTFRYLSESSVERASRAKITHWGGTASDRVSVVKAKGAAPGADSGDDPPPSRQLKDPFTSFYVQGMALEPPLPPERLLNLTEESPFHAACLQAKATDACGRGWSFETDDETDDDAEAVKSPIPKKLKQTMEDLTPDLTFTELLQQAAWEMDAIGWGVWEAVRTSNDGTPGKHGDIGAIYPIPSHTIRACIDPRKWVQIRAGRIRYFKKFGAECTVHNETGEIFEWKGRNSKRAAEVPDDSVASELIIFKTYSPRSLWYGVPRWVSSIATVAELGAIREFNVSWFASGGQVDYHMHFKAAGIEMATTMKEQVEDQVREFAGRGHTNILTAGDESTEVKVQKLGELLREGHFRFRRGDLVKEVLIAHATPPYRIGWAETGSLGGNAAPEMLAAYKVGAIEPIQRVIEDRLRSTLFDPKTGIKTGEFRLKLKVLDLEDLQKELEKVKIGVAQAVVTPNQGRKMLHLTPVADKPEMDEYYYGGQKLGAPPPAPPGGGFGGFGGAGGGNPDGSVGQFDEDPGAELPEEAPPATDAPPKEKTAWEKREILRAHNMVSRKASRAAKRVVVEMIRDYETKLKSALTEQDS